MPDRITLDSAKHGTFSVSPASMDWAIAQFLPASPRTLRDHLIRLFPDIDWSDLTDVSSLLVVLAYLSYEFPTRH